MDFKFLIAFGIGIGVYCIGALVFGLIKRHKNKKKFEQECEAHKNEESKEQ